VTCNTLDAALWYHTGAARIQSNGTLGATTATCATKQRFENGVAGTGLRCVLATKATIGSSRKRSSSPNGGRSSAKLVFNKQWNQGCHCHDYRQALEMIERDATVSVKMPRDVVPRRLIKRVSDVALRRMAEFGRLPLVSDSRSRHDFSAIFQEEAKKGLDFGRFSR
jgi:hypothetical protein